MPTYLIGISQDITKQKLFTEELEKEVRERTAEMESKNQELEEINQRLEQFNYAASHDMQEPLRKVSTFTSFLQKEHAQQLDEEGMLYLEKISLSSHRMKTIIDDLLTYSQQKKGENTFSLVDLNEILKGVEADLELLITQKNATIAMANLPTVMALPGQLQQLFLNLVNNALKFADAERPAKVVVEWEYADAQSLVHHHLPSDKKHVHITVSDNGIGFDPQYAQSIFELFRRLHSKNRFEGSGIGLGLCKKIIQQHSGAIWAESIPGTGAIFHLLLPVKQDQHTSGSH